MSGLTYEPRLFVRQFFSSTNIGRLSLSSSTHRSGLVPSGKLFNLVLALICNSSLAEDSAHRYEIRWQFITVGALELVISNSFERRQIKLVTETRGPLKIFRNYSSTVISKEDRFGERTYRLQSLDRGNGEERKIRYRDGEAPIVETFVELDAPEALATSADRDKNSTDPIWVLGRIIKALDDGKKCDGQFPIYDGKRRYKISTASISEMSQDTHDVRISAKTIVSLCRFKLEGRSIESVNVDVVEENVGFNAVRGTWPFNRDGQRVVDIWFEKQGVNPAYPIRFSLRTPFGRVIGEKERGSARR